MLLNFPLLFVQLILPFLLLLKLFLQLLLPESLLIEAALGLGATLQSRTGIGLFGVNRRGRNRKTEQEASFP